MKRKIKDITGFALGATDGEIGKVKDFYFDDETWTIRYLVVETGSWLFGREVLISPQAILTPKWDDKIFPVNLTKEQIKHSPDIDTQKPVSRQHEEALYQYYPWENYWSGGLWGAGIGVTGMMMPAPEPIGIEGMHKENAKEGDNNNNDNPHLRSTDNITGYNIKATDGEIGEVEDFIIDDASWKISFLLIDTGKFLSGKKVILSPERISKIEWGTSEVTVDATVEQIKDSPEYDTENHITDDYENSLNSYYNRLVSHKQ